MEALGQLGLVRALWQQTNVGATPGYATGELCDSGQVPGLLEPQFPVAK